MPATLNSQKRDPIIWTDLIFCIPTHVPQAKAPKKAAKCHPSATSELQPHGSGGQLGKKEWQMRPLHRHISSVPDEEAVAAKEPPLPPAHPVNSPSPPGNLASQEKHRVKRILVDLTSILEDVMDPSEEEPEERGLQNVAQPPLDPGDSSSEILDPSQEAEKRDLTNDERPSSNARDPSHEDHETETTTLGSEDGPSDQDILTPLSVDECTARTLEGILLPSDEPDQRTPRSFLEITAQQQGLPETDSTTELAGAVYLYMPVAEKQKQEEVTLHGWVGWSSHLLAILGDRMLDQRDHREGFQIRVGKYLQISVVQPEPTPPSPDVQLPTQLLLQRLQETTTSKNHLLIMQVLSSLREELLAQRPDSSEGDKRNHLSEHPMGNLQKHRQPQRNKPYHDLLLKMPATDASETFGPKTTRP
ncbi:uncharacterized protein LOC125432669 [Sphaerodactylus townsendi]|uniref:uncharacterized protein LOC125432669 n=1 Tax=Sphaerodactylus townsendi TaxID=933632 RepID=UPI00202628A9|nr:uncharacterized protein LOC125432669 [Sphaerodactylus townsendi]